MMKELLKLAEEFEAAVRFPQNSFKEMRGWCFSVIATRILFDLDKEIAKIRPPKAGENVKKIRGVLLGFKRMRNELRRVIRETNYRMDPAGGLAMKSFSIKGSEITVKVHFDSMGGAEPKTVVINADNSLELKTPEQLHAYLRSVSGEIKKQLIGIINP